VAAHRAIDRDHVEHAERCVQVRVDRIRSDRDRRTANHASITANVRPTLTTDHGDGVGTMRFQLVATQADREIASAGVDAKRGKARAV